MYFSGLVAIPILSRGIERDNMKLRLCGCTQCKYGRKSNWSQATIKRHKRRNRQQARMKLLSGDWENIENRTVGIYTD